MKNKKIVVISLLILSLLTLFLYLIELLTSKPAFDVFRFTINYAISLPFLLFLILTDYLLVVVVANRLRRIRDSFVLKVIFEGVVSVALSAVLVVVGNYPFIDDIGGYILSGNYWKSVVAALLMNVIAIVILEFFVQSQKNQRLMQENMQMQYMQLKSQINPHFLFNGLNVLVSLINKDREVAVEYTKRMSEVYRYVLTYDLQDTVCVEDEMSFINNYVEILKMRYGKGLVVNIDIKETDRARRIPPMALQVLIENSVKHNVVSASEPLKIDIGSDGMFLFVRNSVNMRFSVEDGLGIGLDNLKKKYFLIAEKNILIENDEHCFTVKLPLL